jgi:hypothetical protein
MVHRSYFGRIIHPGLSVSHASCKFGKSDSYTGRRCAFMAESIDKFLLVSQVITNIMGISAWHKEQHGRADAHVTRVSGCRSSFYQRLVFGYVIKPIMRTRYNIAATPHVAAQCYLPANNQVDIVLYLRKPSVLLAVAIVRVPASRLSQLLWRMSWRVYSHIASVAKLYSRGPRLWPFAANAHQTYGLVFARRWTDKHLRLCACRYAV